jgi:Protein of unknown function (DUF3108)
MIALRLARRFCLTVLIIGIATAAVAEPLTLRYSATWGGGTAADIRLHLEDSGRAFHNRLDIETVGLARLLSGFRARATSAGQIDTHEIAPRAFDAVYDSRKKRDKRINLYFVRDGNGSLVEEGPENSSKDPLIPVQFRRDVIDPLSCITAIRRLVRERGVDRGKGFTIAVYDGKRRFDVEGTVASVESVRWGRSKVDTLNLRLLLRPVAGFDGETDDGYKPDANTREILVTVTNDARAIPLRMALPIAYAPAVIVLDRKTQL